jgi:hypothetical protein
MGKICPECGSDHSRRGGNRVWLVYMMLVAAAVPAVIVFHLSAVLVAGVLLAGVALAHLLLNDRVCLDCGRQWSN